MSGDCEAAAGAVRSQKVKDAREAEEVKMREAIDRLETEFTVKREKLVKK